MLARKLLLLVLPLSLAACGGAQKAAPTAQTVIGKAPQAQQPTGNPAAGKTLFTAQGCVACHTFTPAGSTANAGPNLDKLALHAKEANRGSLAQYTHESIVDPAAYLVPGYHNMMPASFGQTLTPQQVADLVAFLTSGQKR